MTKRALITDALEMESFLFKAARKYYRDPGYNPTNARFSINTILAFLRSSDIALAIPLTTREYDVIDEEEGGFTPREEVTIIGSARFNNE